MGRDNQPKVRQKKQLARKSGGRPNHDRILIVSEGGKTEPNYFNEIRTVYRLPTAYIMVQPGQLGTAPIQVVEYAEQLFNEGDLHKRIRPKSFEQVYTVFDRDDHESYFAALERAKSLDKKLKNDMKQSTRFQAIASVPSFELWLLLHFEDIQAPIHRDEVMRRLQEHIPGYHKGAGQIYSNTQNNIEIATQRAEALASQFTAKDAPEPYTAIYLLVKLLTTLHTIRTP